LLTTSAVKIGWPEPIKAEGSGNKFDLPKTLLWRLLEWLRPQFVWSQKRSEFQAWNERLSASVFLKQAAFGAYLPAGEMKRQPGKYRRSGTMSKLLTGTALGLSLGLTPAVAQSDQPIDETPPAIQDPATPSEAMQDEQAEPAAPPSESTEAPKSILPDQQAGAPSTSPQFLRQQGRSDWLASDLLGKAVVNADNETIGDVDNLVTDESGKIIAVVIGAGGFLGLGEKEVAVRFEDLELSRDENNEVKVMANFNKETLASAPDFETLHEQGVAVGAGEDE